VNLLPTMTIDESSALSAEEARRLWTSGESITVASLEDARLILGDFAVDRRLDEFAAKGIYQ
jgi:hypothetical protein